MAVNEENCRPELMIDIKSTYCSRLLDGLRAAQAESLLADVTIKAGSQRFSCHRIILAANSDYFKVMFTSNFQEKEAPEIVLPSIDGNIFALLHKFLYSGELCIKFEDLHSFLLATDFLQMSELPKILSDAILKSAKGDDYVYLYQTLHVLDSYASLVDDLKCKICRDFNVLCQTQSFLNLSKDAVVSIITDKRLVILSEKNLFDAIMKWRNQNVPERSQFLVELLEHVRLPLMGIDQLTELVEPALRDVQIAEINERIQQVKLYHASSGTTKYKIVLPQLQTTPRKLNTTIMLAISVSSEADTRCTIFQLVIPPHSYTKGLKLSKVCSLECRGIDAMTFTNTNIFYTSSMDLWQFDLDNRSTKRLPLGKFLGNHPLGSSKLTSHHDLLYAFVKGIDLEKRVLVYDPSTENFEVCSPLPGFEFTWENLVSCTCGVFMFVKMFPTKVIHCYQYHAEDNSWSTHDLRNTEELYMIGSWENNVFFRASQEMLYCYNTLTKTLSDFTPLPPVSFSGDRTYIQMVAVGGHIYQLSLDKDAAAYNLMVHQLIMEEGAFTEPYWNLLLQEPVVPILQTELYPFECSDWFGVQLEAFVV
ncbi:kelch-like protein 25 [Anneissia japonica]|uniref:kelch-like protein 25 n=1 Tax=Anneissia japonica TaxID=1529436 RepID=UPI001425958B|nr:kelch-like protein 25 [Anneissia japonica]